MWDYANMSHVASLCGGPKELAKRLVEQGVQKGLNEGLKKGRIQGMLIVGVPTVVIGAGVACYKHLSNKKETQLNKEIEKTEEEFVEALSEESSEGNSCIKGN